MLGRIGRSENAQLIVFTLAILLYLLIQVAESADRLSGPAAPPASKTGQTASLDCPTAPASQQSRQRSIDLRNETRLQE